MIALELRVLVGVPAQNVLQILAPAQFDPPLILCQPFLLRVLLLPCFVVQNCIFPG